MGLFLGKIVQKKILKKNFGVNLPKSLTDSAGVEDNGRHLEPFTEYFLAFVAVRSVRRLSKSLDNQLSHFLFFTFFAFFHFFVHFHFYDFQTTTQLRVSGHAPIFHLLTGHLLTDIC